jgi:hypothetical protein
MLRTLRVCALLCLITIAAAMTAQPTPGAAQPTPGDVCFKGAPADPFIVIDMRKNDTDKAANRVFVFSHDPTKGTLINHLNAKRVDDAIALIRANAKETTDRLVTEKGQTIAAYCVRGASEKCFFEWDETPRSTQFAGDVATLTKIAKKIFGQALNAGGAVLDCESYTLSAVRANLTLTTALGADEDAESLEAKAVTGPIEHWFISADLPLNSVKELKYNNETGELDAKETPGTFYAGISFKTGDVLTHETSLFRNLTLKGLVKISRQPLDSYGFAVGLRGQYLKKLGIDFDLFSPFIGWTSTKEDEVKDGHPVEGGSRKNAFRVGVSFNLDKGLGWVTSSGDGDKNKGGEKDKK